MALKVQYLDVGARQFPVDKFFSFANGSYLLRFRKNKQAEKVFFTVEVFAANARQFLFANQIVYGQPLMDSLLAPFQDAIIALNIDRESSGIGVTDLSDETLGNDIVLATDIAES